MGIRVLACKVDSLFSKLGSPQVLIIFALLSTGIFASAQGGGGGRRPASSGSTSTTFGRETPSQSGSSFLNNVVRVPPEVRRCMDVSGADRSTCEAAVENRASVPGFNTPTREEHEGAGATVTVQVSGWIVDNPGPARSRWLGLNFLTGQPCRLGACDSCRPGSDIRWLDLATRKLPVGSVPGTR
jgi:hypothetical protein